jgi:putative ABC transport system substrate-binding protein
LRLLAFWIASGCRFRCAVKRRDFAIGLSLAALAWAARAQQPGKKQHKIAIVTSVIPAFLMTEEGGDAGATALFEELRRLGHVEGQNLVVDRYSAEGHPERLPSLASEVVSRNPDLILAVGDPVAVALGAATRTIPIVVSTSDPLRSGLVASLRHPGGNITGVSVDAGLEIVGKRLQMLKQAAPFAAKVAYLDLSPAPEAASVQELRRASRPLGVSLIVRTLRESNPAEYQRVFAEMVQEQVQALLVGEGGEPLAYRQLTADLAEQNALPTMCSALDYAQMGGLMAYAAVPADLFAHLAAAIHQILNGANPGDIPVYQPTRFQLWINLKTAEALNLTISPLLQAGADELIE